MFDKGAPVKSELTTGILNTEARSTLKLLIAGAGTPDTCDQLPRPWPLADKVQEGLKYRTGTWNQGKGQKQGGEPLKNSSTPCEIYKRNKSVLV